MNQGRIKRIPWLPTVLIPVRTAYLRLGPQHTARVLKANPIQDLSRNSYEVVDLSLAERGTRGNAAPKWASAGRGQEKGRRVRSLGVQEKSSQRTTWSFSLLPSSTRLVHSEGMPDSSQGLREERAPPLVENYIEHDPGQESQMPC
jgi:hypothetical protein